MAAFEYVALDQRGKQKKGVLEADSPRQVRQQLREKQWMPISVEVTASKDNKKSFKQLFNRSISTPDLALLTRQLATLIGAGLPIIPIVCSSTGGVKLNRWDNGHVIVEMLDPINTEGYDKSNVRELANLTREQMAAKLEELDKEVIELNKK